MFRPQVEKEDESTVIHNLVKEFMSGTGVDEDFFGNLSDKELLK